MAQPLKKTVCSPTYNLKLLYELPFPHLSNTVIQIIKNYCINSQFHLNIGYKELKAES